MSKFIGILFFRFAQKCNRHASWPTRTRMLLAGQWHWRVRTFSRAVFWPAVPEARRRPFCKDCTKLAPNMRNGRPSISDCKQSMVSRGRKTAQTCHKKGGGGETIRYPLWFLLFLFSSSYFFSNFTLTHTSANGVHLALFVHFFWIFPASWMTFSFYETLSKNFIFFLFNFHLYYIFSF